MQDAGIARMGSGPLASHMSDCQKLIQLANRVILRSSEVSIPCQ
jgi:hypothetical protein